MSISTTFNGADGTLVKDLPGFIQVGATDQPVLNGAGGVRSVSTNNSSAGLTVHDTGAQSHFAESVVGSDALSNSVATCTFCVVKAPTTGSSFNSQYNLSYAPGTKSLRLRNGSGNLQIVTLTDPLAVGDVVRLEVQMAADNASAALTAKINGVTRIGPYNVTAYLTQTGAGFRGNTQVPQNPIIDSFSADALGAPDTLAPVLEASPVLDAMGQTSLQAQLLTNEGGPAYAVLYPAALAEPTPSQIEAGQNANGTAATARIVAQSFDEGENTLLFNGATANTAYKCSVVQYDVAGNRSNTVTSNSATTAAVDSVSPVMPGPITIGQKSSGTIAFSFPPGTDNIAVTGYDYRIDGGPWVPMGTTPSGIATGLVQLTEYDIDASALDAAGNRSNIISATTTTYRNGATGQYILDNTGPDGGNPAGILFNDVAAGDEDKWFSFVIVTPPADAASLAINPDGSFVWSGDEEDSFTYQLEVNGASVGTPTLVSLESGTAPPDTQAPTLTSPTLASDEPGYITASATTNEAGGTMYVVVTASATKPTAAQVKAGQTNAGTAAPWSRSAVVISASNVIQKAAHTLTSGNWYAHFIHEDAAGNQSLVATSAAFTIGDIVAPTLSSPTGTATAYNAANLSVTTNEANGTLYAIVSSSSTPPSAAQIKAGQSSGGGAAPWAGNQAVTATGAQAMSATGLTGSATYYSYFLHRDAAGNDSTIVTSATFSTPAAPDVTAPTLSAASGTATAYNASSGAVTTNEGNGTLYWLTNTSTTATAAEVKAGSSKTVTATGAQSTTSSGLSGSTSYRTHFLHRDAAGNDSTVLSTAAFSTPAAPDATAPTLSAPTAVATAYNASSGTVSTNEANGTLYWVTTQNATETAATVKAGSNKAVTATGSQSVTSTGLAGSTSYRTHYLHRDAAGNDSAVSSSAAFSTPATPDVTAPTLSSATGSASSSSSATGSVSTNEGNGTLYWLVNTSTTATAAAVKAGSSQTVAASGVQNVTQPGLTPNTTGYRIHYLHRDAAGNDSAVLTTSAFATPEAPTGEFMKVAVTAQASAVLQPDQALVGSWIDVRDAQDASVLMRIANGPNAPSAAAYCQLDLSPDGGTTVFPAAGGIFSGSVARNAVYAQRIVLPADTMYVRTVFTGNAEHAVTVVAVVTKAVAG